jgi:hypothetical protein
MQTITVSRDVLILGKDKAWSLALKAFRERRRVYNNKSTTDKQIEKEKYLKMVKEQQAINEKPDVIILAQSGDQEVNYSLRWKDEWHNANNLY